MICGQQIYQQAFQSADLSKSFSQLIVSIFIFSHYFLQQILPNGKSVLLHITYIIIH